MKDERVYLGHIRDAINDIEQYTSLGRDAFVAERMRQDAVIRKLEIIGEAVKQLSFSSQLVALGLQVNFIFIQYDLIVLQKT